MPITRFSDFQNLCTEIAESLAEMDGEDLADFANKVLSDTVTYEGNGKFTITSK